MILKTNKGVKFQIDEEDFDLIKNYSGKKLFLGYCNSSEEGREIYNRKAKELFGEFAWLNPKKVVNKFN